MSELGYLAEQVVDSEFYYMDSGERNLAISYASGWFSSNLGKLNNLIYTCFDGENPGLRKEEASIYKSIYLSNFYKQKAAAILKNMDSSNLNWLSVREGDSEIKLQNKNEVAKTYMQLSKDNQENLDKMIASYNLNKAYPRQVGVIYGESEEWYLNCNDVDFSGKVEIPIGSDNIYIPIEIGYIPEKIFISIIKPSVSSPNISYSVINDSISASGFSVSLGAPTPSSGYFISYGVK